MTPHRTPISPRRALAIGAALAASPIAVQVPFALLAARFDYPDVLRRPAAEVLARFAAGGDGLVLTWYAYALCVIPLLALALAVPGAVGASPGRARAIRAVGAIAAVTQLVGLLRWTFVVPPLAEAYAAPGASEASRAAIEVAFEVQHRLFGNLLGEHVGQLALATWTWLVAGAHAPGLVRWLGRAAAAAFLAGLADGLGTVLVIPGAEIAAALPLIAFLAWTVWCVIAGIQIAWGARRGERAASAV